MSDQSRNLLKNALHQIPTLLALAALGGLAWWGHATGWKLPQFSQLTGAKPVQVEKEDWCDQHNVPDSRCIACRPELVGATAADWCREHGVAESKCTICHPEILTKGVAGDWCPEHGLPETSCTLCHPEIAVKGEAPPSPLGTTVSTTQPAQTRPLPDMQAAHNHVGTVSSVKDPRTCQTHNLRVQFGSAQAVSRAGVALAQVAQRPFSVSIWANGELEYDQDRLARISARTAGTAWRVDKRPGEIVKKGDLLALIDAAEVGRAKADLVQAAATVELKTNTLKRLKSSAESGLRTAAELQEADAALKEANVRLLSARQTLVNLGLAIGDLNPATLTDPKALVLLGLPAEIARSLDPKTTTANLLPVLAPFDGTVLSRDVVAGETVDPARPLFVIADTRKMWVILNIASEDAGQLAVGQRMFFQPDTAADSAPGTVTWISTAVDDQTRTVKVRAEIPNEDGRLLARTFGKARVLVREQPAAIAVPSESVQWEGCCHIVFVRLTDDIFQTRKVKLGTRNARFTEITAGVMPGEVVAAAGSQVLRSEILKSNLGAGCADEH